MEDYKKEIEKLKYQLKLVGETIDYKSNPILSLVIELDWGEEDLETAHDIFEEYDNKLENNEDVNWTEFEFRLRNRFEIGYQTVKSIILAFYRNHQWRKVCKGYAKEHDVLEFKEINYGKNAI